MTRSRRPLSRHHCAADPGAPRGRAPETPRQEVKTYSVVFTPEAEEPLVELYRYIEKNASAEIALRYTRAVVDHCESLGPFPHWGTPRDDIRPDLRTTPYKRRTVIAYTVDAGSGVGHRRIPRGTEPRI